MAEVRYSLNGKYFKDYGIYVSESRGIADTLKRKPVNSYAWAEYHGISVDLSEPKFQERLIELQCFIVGENWETLFQKFNSMIRDEFAKPGTQRLLIEPFDYKPQPYEVMVMDEIKVEKIFGRKTATFTLKLIEPNPIKIVLLFSGTLLNLAYDSPMETEIFYGDGTMDSVYTDAAIVGKPFPAGDKHIIIAGNIDKITNLVTNATVLWDRL